MSSELIACQGIPGSFSSIAAEKYFGTRVLLKESLRFEDIFRWLTSAEVKFGVLPLENSLAGSVSENYDLLSRYEISILGELNLRVEHCLLALSPSISISSLRRVYSHYKAIEQCRVFLDGHADLESSVYSDTAGAARFVANSGDPTFAAIASREAAALYGLSILKTNIEDDPNNYTRFVILGPAGQSAAAGNKCSLMFRLNHKPGTLLEILSVLAQAGCNLTKIESRPIHGAPFEYIFYVDFELSNANITQVVEHCKNHCLWLKCLGIYQAHQYESINKSRSS